MKLQLLVFTMSILVLFSLCKCKPSKDQHGNGGEAGGGSAHDIGIPEFPLPPPQPSAVDHLSADYFENATSLSDVDKMLSKALEKSGYIRRSYYYVPDGFALATQLEQIDDEGNSFPDPGRWSLLQKNHNKGSFSLMNYIRALFKAKPGYYRCIVFIITPHLYNFSTSPPTREQTYKWLDEGSVKLPASIGEIKLTDDFTFSAVIYEFKKLENSETPNIMVPSQNSGRTHLKNSNILNNLNQ